MTSSAGSGASSYRGSTSSFGGVFVPPKGKGVAGIRQAGSEDDDPAVRAFRRGWNGAGDDGQDGDGDENDGGPNSHDSSV